MWRGILFNLLITVTAGIKVAHFGLLFGHLHPFAFRNPNPKIHL